MRLFIFLVSLMALCEPSFAHNKRAKYNINASVRGAEHIVLAQVTDVSYAMSKGDNNSEVLPHTFVTYQILKVIKGNPRQANDKITLRFLGGRGNEATFMHPSNYPLFDIGDQDVLFLRGNARNACPLLRCGEGRFRSIQGLLYSDKGHEVIQTKRQEVDFGKHQALPEVMTHTVSKTTIYLKEAGRSSEGPPEAELPVGTQFKTEAFINYVNTKVKALYPPEVLDKWPMIPATDPRTPFVVKPLRDVRSRTVRDFPYKPVVPPTDADRLEQQRYEQNQGNPVIK